MSHDDVKLWSNKMRLVNSVQALSKNNSRRRRYLITKFCVNYLCSTIIYDSLSLQSTKILFYCLKMHYFGEIVSEAAPPTLLALKYRVTSTRGVHSPKPIMHIVYSPSYIQKNIN